MGETTCLLNLCRQMLEANVRPIVFSYHQDIDEKLQDIVGDVRFIDFKGLGFNPLQVIDRQSPMAYLDVAGACVISSPRFILNWVIFKANVCLFVVPALAGIADQPPEGGTTNKLLGTRLGRRRPEQGSVDGTSVFPLR